MKMAKISSDILRSTDLEEWNEFYLDDGKEMISIAAKLLESKKDDDVELGLQIVNRSRFEEHEENPGSATGLENLGFSELIPALVKTMKDHPAEALNGLRICFLHGAEAVKMEPDLVEPFLEDKKLQDLAFRVLVHLYLQKKNADAILMLVKKNKTLLSKFFDELENYATRGYDQSPFISLVIKNLSSKGEAPVRTAVDSLWSILCSGIDVSQALPLLLENEARFGMFSNSNQLIAGIYLKTKDFDALKKWTTSDDDKQAARALRGLRMADKGGVSAKEFLKSTGLQAQLAERAKKLRVPSFEE
jgi:hypothetical protein